MQEEVNMKLKTYYVYQKRDMRLVLLRTIEAEDDDDVRKQIRKEFGKDFKNWDALRKKYVANKVSGEMQGPPHGGYKP